MPFCSQIWFTCRFLSSKLELEVLRYGGTEVELGCDLNLNLLRTWSKSASGQITASFGGSHFRKFLIGGSSLLETSFLFLLSIVLSGMLLMNNQHKRPNENTL